MIISPSKKIVGEMEYFFILVETGKKEARNERKLKIRPGELFLEEIDSDIIILISSRVDVDEFDSSN